MTRRLTVSVEDMTEFCPNLVLQPGAMTEGAWWCGELRPLRNLESSAYILDDIHHHRNVMTAWQGEIRHLETCNAIHDRHEWMEHVSNTELLRSFNIRVFYSGGAEDPRCWVGGITPVNGRHVWGDGSICPFLSSKISWDRTRDTVADFVGHVSVWLITWMVFQQAGVWIVGEHGGTPGYHLAAIRPNEHCWCRSGKKYRNCHMRADQISVLRSGT
jgi:hypothetical protein